MEAESTTWERPVVGAARDWYHARLAPNMSCPNHPGTTDAHALCVRCGRAFCPRCYVLVGGLSYCGPCKEQLVRDLRSGRAATGLAIASPGRRFVAVIIDGMVLAIPLYTIIFVAIALMASTVALDEAVLGLGMVAFQILVLLVSVGGTFLYEWLMITRYGRTLGKMAMRLKVVTPQGHSVSGGQAAGRSAIKQLFSFLSCFGLVDYIPAFFTPEATTVHDMVANCRVIDWDGEDS